MRLAPAPPLSTHCTTAPPAPRRAHLLLPSAAPSLWLSSDTRVSSTYFCSRSARLSTSSSAARACSASSCSRCLASAPARSLPEGGMGGVGCDGQSLL